MPPPRFPPLFLLQGRGHGLPRKSWDGIRVAATPLRVSSSSADSVGPQPSPPHPRDRVHAPLFDTRSVVTRLSDAGLARSQSEAIMRAIDELAADAASSLAANVLKTGDVANAEYYREKSSQELRNELETLRRNETALLRTEIEGLTRSVESVSQRTSEKIASLKADISVDVNNHKAEIRDLGTRTDLRIQEIHHKLTVELSTLKTLIEALKMEATQRAIWAALITFGSILISSMLVE
ncbi:hypothetical protein BC830DRAFT_1060320 [Chytriomyces sp. MP71]|nr:hypothetical protein BC830DRAFT_1060320 [Chytriomyces sp. MP71]